MASGPLDARLLRYASSARAYLALGGVLAVAQTLSTIAFAWGIASTIGGASAGASLASLEPNLAWIVLAVAVKALLVWFGDTVAAGAAARVKAQLRASVMRGVVRLGPSWMATRSSAHISTIAGRGLEALDAYFGKYLPQLILTAVATPILVVVLCSTDLVTGITVLVTLPLIPVFMVLIGWATRAAQTQQWDQLTALSRGFVDLVEGLPTLKIFGRAARQETRIGQLTNEYRQRTMRVLRMSFLSGFVLEIIASLSVALVAVTIGVRLVEGSLGLTVGLFALLLTPEAYLPLRNVGAQFHAAAEGVAASDEVLEVIEAGELRSSGISASGASANGRESMVSLTGEHPATSMAHVPAFTVRGLTVSLGDRVVLGPLTAEFPGGMLTAVVGPSGAGKSTLLHAVLGFVPYAGDIGWGDTFYSNTEAARADMSWVPQGSQLVAGTIESNITLGSASPEQPAQEEYLQRARALACISDLPLDTPLGVNGAGLSGGQALRVALARAYFRALTLNTPILLLDEPTSALDELTEREVVAGLREFAAEGRTLIAVTHRPALTAAAGQVVTLETVGVGQ
jgi:ATP-binding cassette subfamily C protein CydD